MSKIAKRLLAVTMTCLLPMLWTQISAAKVVDRIVAEVNGDIITLSEVQTAARAMQAQTGIKVKGKEGKELERHLLDSLIDRRLARAEAKRRGIQVDKKEMAAALEDFKKRNNLMDDDTLKNALAQSGLTLKELKQNLADQIIQARLMGVVAREKSVVSDAEVRQIYDSQFKGGGGGGAGGDKTGVRLHLRVIKMPFPPDATEAQKAEIKKTAEKVMEEVKGGASFADVAKKYSLDEQDVGFVAQDDLEPKLAEFLSHLQPKDVGPAMSPEGIQLIQLVERQTGKSTKSEAPSYEEAAPRIRRALEEKGMEKQYLDWLKTLRAKAHIKIML